MGGFNSQRSNGVKMKARLFRWSGLACNAETKASFCWEVPRQRTRKWRKTSSHSKVKCLWQGVHCLSWALFQARGFIFGQASSTSHYEMQKRSAACTRGEMGRDFVAAAVRSDSSPGAAKQASLRSPGGRSIPSMVYLCIHIGGEWEWSRLSIVSSLNIFRKPSIVSASSILGSINSEMWPSVFSLARICTINTGRPAPWMPNGMISHRVTCHEKEAKCMARHGDIVLIFFCASKKHTCAGAICHVEPSHISSRSPGGAPTAYSNTLLISHFLNLLNNRVEHVRTISSAQVAVLWSS